MTESKSTYNILRRWQTKPKGKVTVTMRKTNIMRKVGAASASVLLAVTALLASGCSASDVKQIADGVSDVMEIAESISGENTNGSVRDDGDSGDGTVAQNPASANYQWTEWDADEYPDYYRIVGKAVVDSDVPEGEIWYSDLDELGRTQRAVGRITYDMRAEAKERGRLDFPSDADPSGWGHNEQVSVHTGPNGKTSNMYLWNRSHLVASQFLGSYERNNVVTGTRNLKVGLGSGGGTQYCEETVTEYLDNNHDGVVYYSATPVYEGDELVPRSVFFDIKSDDGSIDMQVECFNAAEGFVINYTDGTFIEE